MLLSCGSDTYLDDIEKWRSDRLSELTASDGWTTLIALYWLEQGSQTIGAAEDNDIILPPDYPSNMGSLNLTDQQILAQLNDKAETFLDENVFTKGQVYDDKSDKPSILKTRNYSWYVIERNGRYGIRVKDTLSKKRYALTSLPHYPVNPEWKIKAKAREPNAGEKVSIQNIVGQQYEQDLIATLEFSIDDMPYSLVALDGGPDEYFIIVSDLTTGIETYGGGRYLYAPRAGADGYTYIDLNKLHNPPCVFSDYATCPLPPKQNHIPIAIRVGEKDLNH